MASGLSSILKMGVVGAPQTAKPNEELSEWWNCWRDRNVFVMCSVRTRPWATKYNVEAGLAFRIPNRDFFQPWLLCIFKARPASLPGSTSVVFLPLLLQVQQRDPCSVLRSSRNCWHSQLLEHETSANTGPKQVFSFCLKKSPLLGTLSFH